MPNPVDVWQPWWPGLYANAEAPVEYPGGSESYKLAGKFLAGEDLVEEWGCATTYGKQFIPAPYRGVDGAKSQFNDVTADLREYRSKVPNALIRHVLEHNWEWRTILQNFLLSFTHRAVVILFIPVGQHDINRSFENRVGVQPTPPGLQLDEDSFWCLIEGSGATIIEHKTLTNDTPPFGYERLIYLEKTGTEPGYDAKPPKCVQCGHPGYTQLRTNIELDQQRYEIAYSYCQSCASSAMTDLYSLQTIPEVTWQPR